ncbi:MAG: DUF6049 family protein [Acidimicrobiia bacterium]
MTLRPRTRSVGVVLVLALMAMLLAAVAPTGAGASPVGPKQRADEPSLRLVDQSFYVKDQIEFHVAVTNAPVEGAVWVTVYDRLKSRAEYDASLTGSLPATLAVDKFPLDTVARDDAGNVTFVMKISPNRIFRAAVYPIAIEIRDNEDTRARLVTHIVRVPERSPIPSFTVATVFPFGAAPGYGPSGEVAYPADVENNLGALISALAKHREIPLTVAPTPESLAALNLVRPAAVQQLAASTSLWQVLGRPYVNLDIAALLNSGAAKEIERQSTKGTATLFDTLGVKGSPNTWLMTTPLNQTALEWLADHRFDQLIVADSALTAPGRTLAQPTAIANRDTPFRSAFGTDGVLSARFAEADPILGAYHLAGELVQLWFDTFDAERTTDARGQILVPPANWVANATFIDTLFELLTRPTTTGEPMLNLVTVDQFFQRVKPATDDGKEMVRELRPQTVGDVGTYPDDLAETIDRLGSVAQMSPTVNSLQPVLDRSTYVASSGDLDSTKRYEYLSAINTRLDDVLSLIEPIRKQTVTLTSRSDSIPLIIKTTTDEPLNVLLRIRSPKLDVQSDSDAEIHRLTQRSNRIDVRVKTKSSGAFPVDVEVLTPDGKILVRSTRFTIRSTAVPGVGWVLSGGAGLFLAVWWILHLRRQHRIRRASRSGHPATPGNPTPANDAPVA